ncbi:MAG: hypothetical protein A3D26_03845 [Candidatus Blackburnbacteria bacterium RIFCSPHIGHO2_02_FULL_44_20]|uniref:Uncharacterized protein n=1 Tax=Candidatus Blackburnbacteria bacterium RIFCSPHIGHO2_02_FULL_44_20 TaxID=1797516 RepID=A0A1G1V714_9BACT|nr:MAG: hypothetical protein A3E16_01835 [Candidatus Blackburnbacteria bacterium RIFCSPHIGHO2_12_FULL_44_25]OGY11022.1 MAG: hypothetical protein A3D26_03845 [Candidatus Blackburnbacteria bacterium RIFCSPHIGHO2_02_FULL_44_20]OGY15216.1 MAG: hypothetical protein A3A62_02595 [Candidatus Blackburnbacteria bacterium RIFCSPLOWO2_01_FULL_44_43]
MPIKKIILSVINLAGIILLWLLFFVFLYIFHQAATASFTEYPTFAIPSLVSLVVFPVITFFRLRSIWKKK